MKKRLSKAQFLKATQGLEVGQQTLEIAFGVLVEGRQQADFVATIGVTKGAVSQAVKRVWEAHAAKNVPKGYRQVTALLPEHKAYIVKQWAKDTAKKLEPK